MYECPFCNCEIVNGSDHAHSCPYYAQKISSYSQTSSRPIYLPKITPEIFDEFAGVDYLIESDNGHNPQWSQLAVDFVALLNKQIQEI